MTCRGTTPLLMHNARLSNPLDDVVKSMRRITGKRKKTEEDYEELARLEHMGGLYFDPEVGPYLPGQNFERCLLDAARLTKAGKKIERGVFVETDVNPIAYDGPRTVEGLWADLNFRFMASAKVGSNRVTRTRPHFRQWLAEADGVYDPEIIDLDELADIAGTGGRLIGLGDWRPRFGRFEVTMKALD